jgi:hypothetical protein
MRRRLARLVLLAGALLLLVSLYLPWREAEGIPLGSLNEFIDRSYSGWSSHIGDAAAIAALALAFAAGAALARPRLAERLPLAESGLLAGYLGFAVLAQ